RPPGELPTDRAGTRGRRGCRWLAEPGVDRDVGTAPVIAGVRPPAGDHGEHPPVLRHDLHHQGGGPAGPGAGGQRAYQPPAPTPRPSQAPAPAMPISVPVARGGRAVPTAIACPMISPFRVATRASVPGRWPARTRSMAALAGPPPKNRRWRVRTDRPARKSLSP